jgi:uncharacterized protein (UPF0305 family)
MQISVSSLAMLSSSGQRQARQLGPRYAHIYVFRIRSGWIRRLKNACRR